MTGKPLKYISVGKLKTPFWKDAAAHYTTRITRWRKLDITEVRDGDSALPQDQRNALEGRRIIEALDPQDPRISPYFKLVYDNVFARIYEVL